MPHLEDYSQEKQKSGPFYFIPTSVAENPHLDPGAILLFGLISSLSNGDRFCFASDKYLAQRHHCSEREIRNRLKLLIEEGCIIRKTEKEGMYWKRTLIPNFNYERNHSSASNGKKENSNLFYERNHSSGSRGTTVPKSNIRNTDIDKNMSEPASAGVGRARLLFDKIKENHSKAKPPDLEKWARELDRMHRLDGYTWDEIDKLIEFSQEHEFWRSNILSASKLRKHAQQLMLQMNRPDPKKEEEEKAQTVEDNRDYAKRVVQQNRSRWGSGVCVYDTGVQVRVGKGYFPIGYREQNFKEKLHDVLELGGYKWQKT